MAVTNSPTPAKDPRRMALLVSSANHRSIKLSQKEPVGMKWSWKRGCLGVGVGAVVVQDQVQFQILDELALETSQELQELLVAMPKVDLADHGAVEQVERGEEGGSAVALVVMGHGPAAPLLEGQSRLGPVEGLDLTLLIDAEHDRVFGRIQIEPDHVGQLFDEARIVGEFEAGDPVRLQLMCSPDPVHGVWADTHGLGHGSAAPMGGPRRLAVEGGLDYGLDLLRRDGRLASAALLDLGQGLGPIAGEALSPEQDGGTTDAQGFGDGPVGDPIRCHQDHARPEPHPGGCWERAASLRGPGAGLQRRAKGLPTPTCWKPTGGRHPLSIYFSDATLESSHGSRRYEVAR